MRLRLGYMLLALLLWANPASAWFWDSDLLVTINQQEYRNADYKSWWDQWREPEMEVPNTPDSFIDFQLKVQEAETMELYTRPEYQRKMRVFLKVRSLMLLREEEILAKVGKPPEAELRQLYVDRFLPRFTLLAVHLETEEQAREFLTAVTTQSAQEVLAEMGLVPEERLARLEQAYAERLDPAVWAQIIELEAGSWGAPFVWHDQWNLMRVEEEHAFDPEHFSHVRPALEKQWREEQRAHLNRELLAQLQEKYAVEVYSEHIEALSEEGVPPALEGKVGISFDGGDIPLELLHQSALDECEKRTSTRNNFTYVQALDIVVRDMIAQTLTGFEALQRHYEQHSPFKEIFIFYSQHRLVKELEQMVLKPQELEVSSAEVEQAYTEQLQRFSSPEVLYMVRLETREARLAQQLRQKLQQGMPFDEVVRPLAPEGIPARWVNPQEESETMQIALRGLSPGQSGVLDIDGRVCFFKLIHRAQEQIQPLEQVSEQLRTELEQQKFNAALERLHTRLRTASTIEVDERVWKRVYKEVARDA
ncbi:MAG: peptidylprolyl isomerase [Desulfuromonadaceae bacterium]|nr:peptidylprolyl isomerase [Desulfuromonadaceae bacterium]